MRAKFIVGILCVGAVFLCVVLFLNPNRPTKEQGSTGESQPGQSGAKLLSPKTTAKTTAWTNAVARTHSISATNQEAIDERVNRLMEMSGSGDKEHLREILAEINNPIADIRKTARESAVIFGDRSAIAFLEDQLALTEDIVERKEIADAIETLNLPPMSEVLSMMATNPTTRPREVVQPGQKFAHELKREAKAAQEQQERLLKKQQPQVTRPEAPPRSQPTPP